MKLKKIIATALTLLTFTAALTGCGSKETANNNQSANNQPASAQSSEADKKDNGAEDAAAEPAKSADPVTVKIGVVGAIYEDLWKPAQEALKEEGIPATVSVKPGRNELNLKIKVREKELERIGG